MATSKMKCHYEVLNLARTATDDEIKKSYRKLALRCHPDKNPDNIDECTKQFHLLQQAYEVLIDPQERAWYDKHREAILKGGLGHGDNYEDNSLDVYQYFNASCYTGFGDDESGFYSVYRGVFETLAGEDVEYREEQDKNIIPGFGNSQSLYEDIVGPFYAFWEGYCTAKTYVWVEKYDTREAPHRQVRRAMEQENKKLRDKARKERNEEVRALIAYVRKRDKRVQAHKKKLEERAAEIDKKTEERKKKHKEVKLKKFESYKEADWSAMESLQHELNALDMEHARNFGDNDSDEMEDGLDSDHSNLQDIEEHESEMEPLYDDLYCIACNKPFKTQKAFDNHENSKKHRQNVEMLKTEMVQEDEELGDLGNSEGNIVSKEDEVDDEDILIDGEVLYDDLYCQFCDKVFTDELALYNHTLSKKHKDTLAGFFPDNYGDNADSVKYTDELTDESDDVTCGDKSSDGRDKAGDFPDKTDDVTQKCAEGAQEVVTNEGNKNPKKQKGKKQSDQPPLICNVCNSVFETRNKMFKHINETGHALRVEEAPESLPQKLTGKQKKNKKKKSKF